MTLSYTADTPKEYTSALINCRTLENLKIFGEHWNEMFADANAVILKMTDQDFEEFQRGSKKERRGHYAGDAWSEKYAAILMPELLMRVGLVASHFHAPFGCAWNRLEEFGHIKHNGVCYFWDDKEDGEK